MSLSIMLLSRVCRSTATTTSRNGIESNDSWALIGFNRQINKFEFEFELELNSTLELVLILTIMTIIKNKV